MSKTQHTRHFLEDVFEDLVEDAIDNIPKMYQDKMKHVAILVEDAPTRKQREELGLRRCDALFGLYEGVPLTRRNGSTLSIQPDVITIFRYPMLNMHTSKASLRKHVYETLWHEVAHYFGLNHDQIHNAKSK